MIAKLRLITKAFIGQSGCTALAIKKIGKLLFLGHFITRAKDNKSRIKEHP
jgi:hypothetical protein